MQLPDCSRGGGRGRRGGRGRGRGGEIGEADGGRIWEWYCAPQEYRLFPVDYSLRGKRHRQIRILTVWGSICSDQERRRLQGGDELWRQTPDIGMFTSVVNECSSSSSSSSSPSFLSRIHLCVYPLSWEPRLTWTWHVDDLSWVPHWFGVGRVDHFAWRVSYSRGWCVGANIYFCAQNLTREKNSKCSSGVRSSSWPSIYWTIKPKKIRIGDFCPICINPSKLGFHDWEPEYHDVTCEEFRRKVQGWQLFLSCTIVLVLPTKQIQLHTNEGFWWGRLKASERAREELDLSLIVKQKEYLEIL